MEDTQNIGAQFLGDYKILRYLHKGLWCQDILAEHRFIKKRYVLKVLNKDFSVSEEFMQVFHDTIVKLAAIKHPGILSIENVSQVGEQYFLVTEEREIPTISLRQYLSNFPEGLGELEAYNLIKQLADILDYAHGLGLVHGGLSLDSVQVDLSGSSPKIFLAELGFSFLLQDYYIQHLLKDGLCSLTKLKETLVFQPLEPMEEDIAAKDIYAFGALAYYILARHLPHGVFSLPSEIYPHYIYDWDQVIAACLNYVADKRPKKVASLIVKKTQGEQFQAVKTQCIEEEVREFKEEPSLPGIENILLEGETVLAEEEVLQQQPEFVLVEAKSIDEAMNTSVEPVGESTKEEEGYSNALRSLLTREPVVSRYVEEEKKEVKPQPLFTEMILINGGKFMRGSREGQRDEQPPHEVVLQQFFLDIHPVTNEQFVRYLECLGSEQDKYYNELICLKESRIQRKSGKLVIETGYAQHPVVGVTWYGASGYASWVGKRLPTEAEWEVAASGGTQLRYPCGEEIDKSRANYFSSDTTPVMSYPANSLGLYDMAGNVYEWCGDWYGYDFYEISAQDSKSPQGPAQGVYRVLRGGCWKSSKDDLRCSHRHRNKPGAVNSTYGFRCAKGVS